ncbi:DUF2513 domain-containing protein [Nitrosomonas sp.]|uniref:DUF2513 domain-containing protein n=1 Tax=Nitrosomonas sp. TaxID=42353 RepID=UPI0025CEC4EA|nr:DUF2513 domain-containing protein [Nitrosomonas sp.]MBV6447281.1 hypothetical protein [Nitrosomonas sp.]
MKRDWDLVRQILLNLEEASAPLYSDAIDGCDPALVSYHYRILGESGLIEAHCRGDGPNACIALRLTWSGHELLDTMRSQRAWQKLRSMAVERGLSLSFDVIKTLACRALEKML